MATVTVRGLDDAVRDRLRIRAARHGRSMEREIREILAAAVADPVEDAGPGLGTLLHQRFAGLDADLVMPRRDEPAVYVTFEGADSDDPDVVAPATPPTPTSSAEPGIE